MVGTITKISQQNRKKVEFDLGDSVVYPDGHQVLADESLLAVAFDDATLAHLWVADSYHLHTQWFLHLYFNSKRYKLLTILTD